MFVLRFTNLSFTGDETLNKRNHVQWDSLMPLLRISSEIDISHNDVTLYYELLDNVVSLDVGKPVRIFMVRLRCLRRRQGVNRSVWIRRLPMLYAVCPVQICR